MKMSRLTFLCFCSHMKKKIWLTFHPRQKYFPFSEVIRLRLLILSLETFGRKNHAARLTYIPLLLTDFFAK